MRELLSRIWKKDEGFSLIELIIVIAILAIIAAIAVPNLLNNIGKANIAADESNAKLIADAVATFVAQNPTYESTAVGASGAPLQFIDTSADDIIAGASAILNDANPKVKGKTDTGNSFYVYMTTGGVITVYSDAAGANVVFP